MRKLSLSSGRFPVAWACAATDRVKAAHPAGPRTNFPKTLKAYPPNPAGYRSEEHTSELQSLMRISYAVFCLKKKNTNTLTQSTTQQPTHSNSKHHSHTTN